MSLHSTLYLAGLPIVWLAVRALPTPMAKQLAALATSYAFYAAVSPGLWLLTVLVASSSVNFAVGRLLIRRRRASVLALGVTANVVLLAIVRFAQSMTVFDGSGWFTAELALVAAVGISFYTFQGISYLVDTYRGATDRPTVIEFFLYMAFWPTVLAGPICRMREMLPQFRQFAPPSREQIAAGTHRIVIGLVMKIVLADTLARGLYDGEGVAFGFDSMSSGWSGVDVWALAVGFGLQLYFDFAGYSHIAIGTALLFGLQLRENFALPYLATTLTEFWARWHMSLSTWIRDYLFFPIAARGRTSFWRNTAVLISMSVFGIWHGFFAKYLLWGVYHGSMLIVDRQLSQRFPRRGVGRWAPLNWMLTMMAVAVGWTIFRANDVNQSWHMLQAMFNPSGFFTLTLRPDYYILVAMATLSYAVYLVAAHLIGRMSVRPAVARAVWIGQPVYYAAAILAVIIWSGAASPFVYFQF